MAYEKLNWQDGKQPALNAANLNHMEDGIVNADAAAANATTTAQAAATVANNALEVAQAAGMKFEEVYTTPENSISGGVVNIAPSFTPKMLLVIGKYNSGTYYSANLLPWEFGKKFACSAFGAEMNYELKGRYITITNGTTLTLSNGYTWNNANATNKEDVFACVPYKIYAIG